MTQEERGRRQSLEVAGLLHPDPAAVSAPLFSGSEGFFLPADKVQVKYEMLRARAVDGLSAAAAAREHGYSRAAFYLVEAAFESAGMLGLLDERRGRKGPVKLTAEILAFLQSGSGRSGADLAAEVEAHFGVRLHRRTVERARSRP
ncbi:MAG: helix-turn-helix domain-containing protein [Acidimicrobiia bacterium]